ncbi:MAG: alpha-L-fucosidase [Bryobacteraceae bacterium]
MQRRDWLRTMAAAAVAGPPRAIASAREVLGQAPASAGLRGPARFGDGRDWFFQKRFGLFVHWGLYAIPGWHEQHMYRLGWTRDQYRPLLQQFNPRRFDPARWVEMAESAGMEYLCVTSKHIDGFCMWDTRETSFNVMHTPYRKDVIRQIAEACHRRAMPFEFYYSVVDEWHPNYPNTGRPYEFKSPQPGDQPDLPRYVEYVKRQIRELCTDYGEIHGVWFDGNVLKYRDPSFREMIHSLQPKAVINNRGFDEGDYDTPERDYDKSADSKIVFDKPVEACESVGYQSWGYRKDEDYYLPEYLIRSMHKVMARGGNYLLNAGPTADGDFPRESLDLLARVGRWYRTVKESLVDVGPGPRLSDAPNVITTQRTNIIYVHLLSPLATSSVFLHPLDRMPVEAVLMNTGQRLACDVAALPRLFNRKPPRCLRLRGLPADTGSATGWVVRLRYPAGAR